MKISGPPQLAARMLYVYIEGLYRIDLQTERGANKHNTTLINKTLRGIKQS